MATDEQLAKMPISEAVRQSGGNGLASPSFQSPLNFFNLFGWQHVESGVEALICDGELVKNTRYTTEIARLFGRRRFVRRVLLKPAPLEIVAKALTFDQLELTLTVALKYEVVDPVYVASLQDPLAELTNLAIGIVAEYIRTQEFDALIGNEGVARTQLQERLSNSRGLQDAYAIREILKALPSGDERLIEIKRRARAAKAETGLVDATGHNRLIESDYQRQIDQAQANLQEEMTQRQHERDMEKMKMDRQTELAKTAMETLGAVAASGMDPAKLAKDVIGLLIGQVPGTGSTAADSPASKPRPTELVEGQTTQADVERTAFASIKDSVGIVTYEVIESKGRLRGAVVQMPDYEIAIECKEHYPDVEPVVTVRYPEGQSLQPNVLWIPGVSNSLAQVILSVIPQAQRGKP